MIAGSKNHATHTLAGVLIALACASSASAQGLARGHLYSTAAVNRICGEAQAIVATTNLEVSNSIFSDWEGFVQSDALPYSVTPGFPTPTYNPPEEPDLPFTSTQHVIYGLYGTGMRDYPQVVSCKMKNAEYLVKTAMDTNAVDQPCSAVNDYYVNEVVASLTNKEIGEIVMEPDDEIVIDDTVVVNPDEPSFTGSEWTDGFPDNPYPVLYREFEGGPLHVKSRALLIPTNPPTIFACNSSPFLQTLSFCEPRKWGVRYCHLPAPEYIRGALTGEIEVPILPTGP